MIISYQKHIKTSYTPCVEVKGKCTTVGHYEPTQEEFPNTVVTAIIQRMQSGPFSAEDLVGASLTASSGLLPEDAALRLVNKIMAKYKRAVKDVREPLVAYDKATRSWAWQGKVGGL